MAAPAESTATVNSASASSLMTEKKSGRSEVLLERTRRIEEVDAWHPPRAGFRCQPP